MQQSAFLAQSSRTIQDTSEDEDDEDDEYSETTSEDELPTSTIDQDAATRLIQKDLVLVCDRLISQPPLPAYLFFALQYLILHVM